MSPLDMIGHRDQRTALQEDLQSGNVAHAYILAGPAHVGKFTIAKWFAGELLTQGKSPEERERSSAAIGRLIHPDYLVLDQLWIEGVCEETAIIARTSNLPQHHRSKSPGVMRTDTISIDDVRVIQERLQETGTGHYRCCLIRSIERMRDEAANAFLKMLEEPPEGRVFLLTASSIHSLLPTVRSRARMLLFSRLSRLEMDPLFAGYDGEEADFLFHLSQGAPGIVRALLSDPELLRKEKLLQTQALSFWSSSSLAERMSLIEPLLERGKEAERFLLHLSLALRRGGPPYGSRGDALACLIRELGTNAHRQLIAQRFAFAVTHPGVMAH